MHKLPVVVVVGDLGQALGNFMAVQVLVGFCHSSMGTTRLKSASKVFQSWNIPLVLDGIRRYELLDHAEGSRHRAYLRWCPDIVGVKQLVALLVNDLRWSLATSSYSSNCLRISKLRASTLRCAFSIERDTMPASMASSSARFSRAMMDLSFSPAKILSRESSNDR